MGRARTCAPLYVLMNWVLRREGNATGDACAVAAALPLLSCSYPNEPSGLRETAGNAAMGDAAAVVWAGEARGAGAARGAAPKTLLVGGAPPAAASPNCVVAGACGGQRHRAQNI